MNYHYPSHSSRSAFTLIELLVVVAIISILAAIIFPVFAQAREKARLTTCQSNLRQIGLAFMQYNEDWDETYPCVTTDQQLWQGEHFRWTIMPYLGINQQQVTGSEDATTSNAMILNCPSDPAKSFNNTSYFYSMAFYVAPKDLKVIAAAGAPQWLDIFTGTLNLTPQTLGKVNSPTQKILAGEWADNHDKVYSPPQGFYPPLTRDVWRSYLFADGHVRYIDEAKIQNGYDNIPDPNTTINGVGGEDVL